MASRFFVGEKYEYAEFDDIYEVLEIIKDAVKIKFIKKNNKENNAIVTFYIKSSYARDSNYIGNNEVIKILYGK